MSLTELIVAMVLLGIVGVMVTGLYASTMHTVSQTASLSTNTREASNGMNEVARVIRAATENPVAGLANQPALEEALSESVTLYAYINLTSSAQLPMKIKFSVDPSGRLIETQWPALETSPGSGFYTFTGPPSSTRIVAGTLAPPVAPSPGVPAQPLFSYLLGDGTAIVAPATGLTEAQRGTVAAITVTMTLQSDTTDSSSAVTLRNTVGMPNLPIFRTGP